MVQVSFGPVTSFNTGVQPRAVAVGDFNNDGNLDLVTANNVENSDLDVANTDFNNISILLGDGTGSFGTTTSFPVGSAPQSVAIGYFNNDGNLDFVTSNVRSNNVSILIGNGEASQFAIGGEAPFSIAIGNFN